jgi:predicted nucleic acid-binding Zn finger protein
MQSLSRDGACYRTKLLDLEQAARFARCLGANPLFSAVAVEESPRSAGRFFVSFVPTNPERRQAMVAREQDKRHEKAVTEGQRYLFCLDKDGGRPFFWCLSTSGEVYEVTPETCSCPDHQFRCAPNGLKCKHRLALIEGHGTQVDGFSDGYRDLAPGEAMVSSATAEAMEARRAQLAEARAPWE